MRKFWLAIGALALALVLAPVLLNFDVVTGWWKFERMCKAEGGPRYFGVVEKDVGWEVDAGTLFDYKWPFVFGHIGFVRFRNEHNALIDVREGPYENIAGGRYRERTYIFSPADESKQVRYKLRYSAKVFDDDPRFSKTEMQVIDISTGYILASLTTFGYEWGKFKRVILSAPTGNQCWYEKSTLEQFYHDTFNARE